MTAVDLALAKRLPSKTHTLHILHRLLDIKVIGGPPLDTPQALTLRRDSKALRACGIRVSARVDPRQAPSLGMVPPWRRLYAAFR